MEQSGQLLVQGTDLLLEDLQVLQGHFQEPAVHGLEFRARAECITQLLRRGAQSLMRQSGQRCWIGFSVSQRLQHAPGTLTPSRSETRLAREASVAPATAF